MKKKLTKSRRATVAASLAAALALLAASVAGAAAPDHDADAHTRDAQHVLLLSVDGLHQSDLRWYDSTHPHSALASLSHDGVEFTHAQTPVPSDSFPGMVGQVTGGNPGSTGIYYDVTY